MKPNNLQALKKSCRYLIHKSEDGVGVGLSLIKNLRYEVLSLLGQESYNYLEKHLDGRSNRWRISSAFSVQALIELSKK